MRKLSTFLLILALLLSLSLPAMATDTEVQYQYSTQANSGVRHEICTTLDGTSAHTYYTGDYTFDLLSQQAGNTLLQSLRTLMKSTHKKTSSYADCRDMAVKTDCENGDGVTISLLYSSYVATWADWTNNKSGGWNREHVWPQSLGGFSTTGAGADLHHVRPSDSRINSVRGNDRYGNVTNGSNVSGTAVTQNALGGTRGGGYFEPLDNVKGDVARICLYVYVRYGGEISKCSSITNVFESIDVLLEWCAMDPVDTWEMGRNEVVAAYQGNRNVFIDYPEYAWLIFDRQIPEDIMTPTSQSREEKECTHSFGPWITVREATVDAPGLRQRSCTLCAETESEEIPQLEPCKHTNTQLREEKSATCTAEGYTGDTYCADCGEKIETGTAIAATGHEFGQWTTVKEPTEEAAGLRQRSCTLCAETESEEIPQLESTACQHPNVEGKNGAEATCGKEGYSGDVICVDCGEMISAGSVIPATGEHTYGPWEKTENEDVEARSCEHCGYSQSREAEIPAEQPVTEENDYTRTLVIVVACLVSVGMMFLNLRKRKEKS